MRYFKNTSWLMAEKILRIFVGLFVGIWVARYLGPEQYGIYNYVQSFVSIFAVIATFGLEGVLVRELIKYKYRINKIIGTAFWLKIFGAFISFIFIFFALFFTSNTHQINVFIYIVASSVFFQSFNVVDMYFQAKVLSKYVVIINTIALTISSILKIIFILKNLPLGSFIWLLLLDSIILGVGFLYFYLKHSKYSIFSLRFDKYIAIKLVKNSYPLILASFVLLIQAKIDQIMIFEMLGSKEAGYYSIAMYLIAALAFLPSMISASLFPALFNAKKISELIYKERFLNYYRLSFVLFLLSALPIYLFAEQIVFLLYGESYRPAGAILALLSIRLFFTNSGYARQDFIKIENLFIFALITMTVGAIVNILLNFIWIKEYGAQGAIYSSIVSFSFTLFIVDYFYEKTRENVKLQLYSIITFYKIKITR